MLCLAPLAHCTARYSHFWRRFKSKWKKVMGFASISDQLACDSCSEFKQEFHDAKEP